MKRLEILALEQYSLIKRSQRWTGALSLIAVDGLSLTTACADTGRPSVDTTPSLPPAPTLPEAACGRGITRFEPTEAFSPQERAALIKKAEAILQADLSNTNCLEEVKIQPDTATNAFEKTDGSTVTVSGATQKILSIKDAQTQIEYRVTETSKDGQLINTRISFSPPPGSRGPINQSKLSEEQLEEYTNAQVKLPRDFTWKSAGTTNFGTDFIKGISLTENLVLNTTTEKFITVDYTP